MAPSKSKRSLSSLPFDLVEDIFYRIPIESLVRYKSVCKQWCTLLNDKRFIYKHLNLSQVQHFIRFDGKSTQLFNLETQDLSRLQGPSDISTMIHCDGLLLCWCVEERSGGDYIVFRKHLVVWNPFLRRVKRIKPSYSDTTLSDVYGFGYDNVSRDNYKILRFHQGDKSYVEIYEFKSRVWRSVDANFDGCCGVKIWREQCHAVSVNGNMYWIAYRNKDNSDIEFFIQSFDYSTETFKHICCLTFESDWLGMINLHTIVLSGFGGDRLSLLHQQKDVKMIEVWVTNEVTDRVVLWSKYFNVTLPDIPIFYSSYDCSFFTYFIHKTNNIMFEGESKIKIWTGRLYGSRLQHCYVNYVPSLVAVPE